MRREETIEIITCDFCGKEITGDPMQSPETSFTRVGLDYSHGIWMGEVGEMYTGSSSRGNKEFCSLDCLIEDLRRFFNQAKQTQEFKRLGGKK